MSKREACRRWLKEHADGKKRKKEIAACARATKTDIDTARRAWKAMFNSETMAVSMPNGRKAIKGAKNIDELLKSTDPMQMLFTALGDLEPNQTVDDSALFNHVRDSYCPALTKSMWHKLRRMDCFAKWQFRKGTSIQNWGHPQAIIKQRNAEYKYV
jgi:hypothetical protein